jgi:hypothetical protein|tara:strand:- start:22118 stop:22396 length:279 start_codon:yes stop_codon:yes gene_type:complete
MENLKVRVVPDWKEMSKVLRWTVSISVAIFLIGFMFLACDEEFYLGKTREELYREMFIVDSLMMQIQMQLDSTSIEFEKFYIDAQRINNGHQ